MKDHMGRKVMHQAEIEIYHEIKGRCHTEVIDILQNCISLSILHDNTRVSFVLPRLYVGLPPRHKSEETLFVWILLFMTCLL